MTDRFQTQWYNGDFCKSYKSLAGAKIAVAYHGRKYRIFSYRAVDTETGETWRFDRDEWKMVRET